MDGAARPLRVLYSFPLKIGAGRICYTAWEQVRGLRGAGVEVHVVAGSVARAMPPGVTVTTTLARGRVRLPYRVPGIRNSCALHDRLVARMLPALADQVDVVHAWPLGAERTLRVAADLGIPTVLERPNAHTALAFEVVAAEAARIGVRLPRGAEHAYDERVLRREEREYAWATRLLCPSEFVVRSFVDRGFERSRLVRHTYGYEPDRFSPGTERPEGRPFTVVFAGFAGVRKGLHLALDAWLASPASHTGRFLIAGDILPVYREHLAGRLAHGSVQVLGHRDDLPELLGSSDVLVLPSVEEGFGLVCVEAMATGCVPLVSDACTDLCQHGRNALVHAVGDVGELSAQFTRLASTPQELARLREGALATAPSVTWDAAGRRLRDVYREVVDENASASPRAGR